MGTSLLKSVPLTNLDTIPVVPNTAGEGAPGYDKAAFGFITAVAADAAGSIYRLQRIPSNAKVNSILFESEAQGAGKVQLGLYYSTSTVDGTAPANQGLVIDAKFFSDDIDCTSAVLPTEKVFGTGGTNTMNKRNQPIWQAAGLASDPGGFFDVAATVHTTAITTGTGRIGAQVTYAV